MVQVVPTFTKRIPPGAAGAGTLQALMEREKAAAAAKNAAMQPQQIQSPWQGAAQIAGVIGAGIREGRADKQEAAARNELANIMAGIKSGQASPEQIAMVQQIAPDVAAAYMEANNSWQNNEAQRRSAEMIAKSGDETQQRIAELVAATSRANTGDTITGQKDVANIQTKSAEQISREDNETAERIKRGETVSAEAIAQLRASTDMSLGKLRASTDTNIAELGAETDIATNAATNAANRAMNTEDATTSLATNAATNAANRAMNTEDATTALGVADKNVAGNIRTANIGAANDLAVADLQNQGARNLQTQKQETYRPPTPEDLAKWPDVAKRPADYKINVLTGAPELIRPTTGSPIDMAKFEGETRGQLNSIDSALNNMTKALQLAPDVIPSALGQTAADWASYVPAGFKSEEVQKKVDATKRFFQLVESDAMIRMANQLKGSTALGEIEKYIRIFADPNASAKVKMDSAQSFINILQKERELASGQLKGLTGADTAPYQYTDPDAAPAGSGAVGSMLNGMGAGAGVANSVAIEDMDEEELRRLAGQPPLRR